MINVFVLVSFDLFYFVFMGIFCVSISLSLFHQSEDFFSDVLLLPIETFCFIVCERLFILFSWRETCHSVVTLGKLRVFQNSMSISLVEDT